VRESKEKHPDIFTNLRNSIPLKYKDENMLRRKDLLTGLPYFRLLKPELLYELIYMMKTAVFTDN
jgi:hypothetical protein